MNARTRELLKLEEAHIWPPYTQAAAYFSGPRPVIERAEGVFLYDTEGNRYYDMIASWWVNLHGHNHPRLNQALIEQAGKWSHSALAGITHEPAVRLAAELAALAPRGLSRVFFSDDGSTAVEVALKIALQYYANTGRPKKKRFAAMTGAYHGDTLGAVALGGIQAFHQVFEPAVRPAIRFPAPACDACPFGLRRESCGGECFEGMEKALAPHADELCAIVVEPLVQGAVGMRMYSPQILVQLRAFCDRHDILLIDDEVAMGFGRTGRVWACEHAAVIPDLLCCAKGLTGGYLPLSATLATEKIYSAFLGVPGDGRTFFHGHSFTGNPLAAAVARESLALLREALPELPGKIEALARVLEGYRAKPWVQNVRQCGLVAAFELAGGQAEGELGRRAAAKALAHGVYLRPLGDTLYFLPPLSITPREIADLGARVAAAVEDALVPA